MSQVVALLVAFYRHGNRGGWQAVSCEGDVGGGEDERQGGSEDGNKGLKIERVRWMGGVGRKYGGEV